MSVRRLRSGAGAGLVLIVAAGSAFTACGTGDGPTGVASIGGRENPGYVFEDPHDSAAPVQAAANPTATVPSGPVDSGPVAPSDSGGPTLTSVCAGSFNCSGFHVSLSSTGGKCTFTVNGQTFILHDDTTVTTLSGAAAGTWLGSTGGFQVIANGNTTTCVPEAPDSGP